MIAQTDVDKGHRGINALIVERDMPGFIVGAKEDKMGRANAKEKEDPTEAHGRGGTKKKPEAKRGEGRCVGMGDSYG